MLHCKLYLVKAVALLGTLALLAPTLATLQAQGPIGGQPRRPLPDSSRRPGTVPGPGGVPDAPTELPRVQTRAPQRTPEEQPLFTADTNVVTVDIAVLDNKGQFIPNIPA
ncbi:MAG: hypothetical protein OXB91_11840, partial [Bryobacterales bacterium]|nr:hypothetical protein [Bryobacterales bacterium]